MAIPAAATLFAKQVGVRILEVMAAPFKHSEMFWILTPMLLAMILMSLYFGRYKKEELGWNTAFGNSMVLIFASVDMLRYQYNKGALFSLNPYTVIALAIVIEGFFLTFFTFFHLLPKSWAFSVASGVTINVVVLFALILIYGQVPIDGITAVAALILAMGVVLLIRVVQIMEPEAIDDDEDY
jgi:hypothetical protein